MAAPKKNTVKRGKAENLRPFTSNNQPSPEAKKLGWEELRKRRLLTQGIIKELINDDGTPKPSFHSYFKALIDNAKAGNAKSIETVNKALEDDIIKVAQVDSDGNDVQQLPSDAVDKILKKIDEIR